MTRRNCPQISSQVLIVNTRHVQQRTDWLACKFGFWTLVITGLSKYKKMALSPNRKKTETKTCKTSFWTVRLEDEERAAQI